MCGVVWCEFFETRERRRREEGLRDGHPPKNQKPKKQHNHFKGRAEGEENGGGEQRKREALKKGKRGGKGKGERKHYHKTPHNIIIIKVHTQHKNNPKNKKPHLSRKRGGEERRGFTDERGWCGVVWCVSEPERVVVVVV